MNEKIMSRVLSKTGRDNWDNIFQPKKTSRAWLNEMINPPTILDADGWREKDGVTLDTHITQTDFNRRLNCSTLMNTIPTRLNDVL